MQAPTENTQQQLVFTFTLNIINTISHLLLGAVAFGAICFANLIQGTSAFKQHIYLCVIGYVILMAQAVLAMNPYNSWSNVLTYQDKKISHWVMQVLGSILAIAGCILKLTDKDVEVHFSTAHGVIGFVTMILTILSLIGGILNIYSLRLQLNVTFMRTCHSGFGSLVLIMAFTALCLGFHDVYRLIMRDDNANMMIVFTILALLGVILPPCLRILSRLSY